MNEWDSRYPDLNRLRAEVMCLAECVRDQLLAQIPETEIRGIYLKGSALKPWESPLDYVPEVSDVDLQVWFHHDAAWPEFLGTVSKALEVQKGVEMRFLSRIPVPLHEPRPQLIVMNKLMTDLDHFVHSPRSTVGVLYGDDYPLADYSDGNAIRRHDATSLAEQGRWAEDLPLRVVDKPGGYLREALRYLSFRVSPVCSRVLHLSGVDTETSWSLNRTKGTAVMRDRGFATLAESYTAYYLSAWEYFLSGYADFDAGRSTIEAASKVLAEGTKLGRRWLAANPRTKPEE